jgi:hypothetical protein
LHFVFIVNSFYTLTTTGFGQVQLVSDQERVFSIIVMVIGVVICNTGITAVLTTLFCENDQAASNHKRRSECTNQYLRSHNFDAATRGRIESFSKHICDNLNNHPDMKALEYLSLGLRRRISKQICFENFERSKALYFLPISPMNGLNFHQNTKILFDYLTLAAVADSLLALAERMSSYYAVPLETLLHQDRMSCPKTVLLVLIEGNVVETKHTDSVKGKFTCLKPGHVISNLNWDLMENCGVQSINVVAQSYSLLYKLNTKERDGSHCHRLPPTERLLSIKKCGISPSIGLSILCKQRCFRHLQWSNCGEERTVQDKACTTISASKGAFVVLECFLNETYFQSKTKPRRLHCSWLREKVHPIWSSGDDDK